MKELAGNPGHRPLNAREPQPPASTGRCPPGLGAEGGRFYRRYGPMLAALHVLTQIDEPALRMAAEHYEIAVRAALELREGVWLPSPNGTTSRTVTTGLLVEDDDGNLRKNPLLQVLRDNSTALRSFLTEFGMTPASRSKIRLEEDDGQLSLVDQLFARVADAATPADVADPLGEFGRE